MTSLGNEVDRGRGEQNTSSRANGRRTAPYRVGDDSVTVSGKGHPEYSGKSVTVRGEERRQKQGPEPGRYDVGSPKHPEREEGKSTARDVTSVRPKRENPILPKKMPNLR